MTSGQKCSRTVFDNGVALDGDLTGRVVWAFTERTGGISLPPYSSLNLGTHVGDEGHAVLENRRRVLAALDADDAFENLLVPNQVHGDHVVVVDEASSGAIGRARDEISQGCDAIVCTVPGVPVMLCYADCAPVVLTCKNAFAVVHSGWRGTYARIAGKTARALMDAAGCVASDLSAYIGPHILGDEYEVSADLLMMFSKQFDNIKITVHRTLDLSECIRQSLEEVGVLPCEIHDLQLSTVRQNERFFSYRAEQGICGRHGAVAYMR